MAKKVNSQATSYKDYMGLPINIKRGNPVPLDTTAVWYDETAMKTYAKTGATAYVGQILVLALADVTEAYVIKDEAGTLIKLATTTASGDLASDVAALQGKVTKLENATIEAADGSVTITKDADANKTTVKVNVSSETGNSLSLKEDGLFSVGAEYGIVKNENGTYQLTKDGEKVADAIIEADQVVKSGTVETYEEAGAWGEAGTYIVLTIANATSDKLYINVAGLIEYVAAGEPGTNEAVKISVSKDHKVTADLIEGKVLGKHLADSTVTLGKLASGVQASLGKADTAIQSVTESTANGKISVDGTDVAVYGLTDAAFETIENIQAGAVSTADNNAETKIKTAIGTLPEGTANVITYVDNKVKGVSDTAEGLDTRLTAAEGNINALDGKIETAKSDLTTEIGKKADSSTVTTEVERLGGLIDSLEATHATNADGSFKTVKTEAEAAANAAIDELNLSGTYAAKSLEGTVSNHTSDTTVHVTADERTKWNGAVTKASANETAITTLNGDSTVSGSVDNKVKAAIDKLSVDDAAVAKQFVTAIDQKNGKVTVTRRALEKADIPTIDISQVSELQTKLDEKQGTLGFAGTYNKSTNPVATKSYVDDLAANAMHYIGLSTTDPTSEGGPTIAGYTKAFKAGDVVSYNNGDSKKEFVLEASGTWRELGDEGSYVLKHTITEDDFANGATLSQARIKNQTTDANGWITLAIKAATDAAAAADTKAGNAATAAANADTKAQGAVDRLDILEGTDTVEGSVENSIKVGIEELCKESDTRLATIAKTGNVNDLIQTAGDVIVFDCN